MKAEVERISKLSLEQLLALKGDEKEPVAKWQAKKEISLADANEATKAKQRIKIKKDRRLDQCTPKGLAYSSKREIKEKLAKKSRANQGFLGKRPPVMFYVQVAEYDVQFKSCTVRQAAEELCEQLSPAYITKMSKIGMPISRRKKAGKRRSRVLKY